MKPDAKAHNPDPEYLRCLVLKANKTQREIALLLGISERVIRYYLSQKSSMYYRPAPYTVQFAIECLAQKEA